MEWDLWEGTQGWERTFWFTAAFSNVFSKPITTIYWLSSLSSGQSSAQGFLGTPYSWGWGRGRQLSIEPSWYKKGFLFKRTSFIFPSVSSHSTVWGQIRSSGIQENNVALSFTDCGHPDWKGLTFASYFTTEKHRARRALLMACVWEPATHKRGEWIPKGKRKKETLPKERVLIEFGFKTCKFLDLLKANEALMLQSPLCLLDRTSWCGRGHHAGLSRGCFVFQHGESWPSLLGCDMEWQWTPKHQQLQIFI